MKRLSTIAILCLVVLTAAISARAADAQLQPGDYVAVIGDSITEQKIYSVYIEDYLLMCQPALNLRVTQFGWGGETAPGYAGRMANDTLRFQPTIANTCFGMNDGGYSPMDPGKAKRYADGQKSIVTQLKKANVRLIVVGSPGVVDSDTFRKNPELATMYNKTLAEERDIAQRIAQEEGVIFANVFDPMMAVMTKAKAKYGKDYHLAGGDGVHPDRNGHLVMAYAFLKAMGCDGNIGAFTVNLDNDSATATDGHKVLSSKGGVVEIQSTRYPFCFFGDAAQPGSTRGVIEFLPFNQDLNRMMLVVSGAKAANYKVTWGQTSKQFTAAELTKGINLAAQFLDNPFADAFRTGEAAIARQQNMETALVKNLLHNIPAYKQFLPEDAATMEKVAEKLVQSDKPACQAAAAAVTPVKHTIKIEPVQ